MLKVQFEDCGKLINFIQYQSCFEVFFSQEVFLSSADSRSLHATQSRAALKRVRLHLKRQRSANLLFLSGNFVTLTAEFDASCEYYELYSAD